MRWILLALPLVLAGCNEPSAEEVEEARRKAVEEVVANQKPPPEMIELQPFRYPEIERFDLFGAGCAFAPDGKGLGAVALAKADKGYLLEDGELQILAADMGSGEKPFMSRAKYDGRKYSFTLDFDEEDGRQSGYETVDYRGTLTVRDGSDNAVYSADGIIQCGS